VISLNSESRREGIRIKVPEFHQRHPSFSSAVVSAKIGGVLEV